MKSLRENERKYKFLGKHQSIRTLSIRKKKDIKILLRIYWHQTKELCHHPYLSKTVLTCYIQFGIFASYYTLMLWFPDIFNRMDEFRELHPNVTVTVCRAMESKHTSVAVAENCVPEIDDHVFVAALWVGMACIPSSIWLPLCVHRLGAKFFLSEPKSASKSLIFLILAFAILVLSLVVSGVSIILMNFSTTTIQSEILACFFESMASLAESSTYCVLVDLYPTRLRVMATALALTVGRAGALFGSLMFGSLVELNCFVPVVIFALLLFSASIMSSFLPHTGREQLN